MYICTHPELFSQQKFRIEVSANKYTYIHSNGVVDVLPVNNNYKKPNTIHI